MPRCPAESGHGEVSNGVERRCNISRSALLGFEIYISRFDADSRLYEGTHLIDNLARAMSDYYLRLGQHIIDRLAYVSTAEIFRACYGHRTRDRAGPHLIFRCA